MPPIAKNSMDAIDSCPAPHRLGMKLPTKLPTNPPTEMLELVAQTEPGRF